MCRNAIHAGIVELPSEGREKLRFGDLVGGDVRLSVRIDGVLAGDATLAELPGGPQGTVGWLQSHLTQPADRTLLRSPGTVLLTGSPAGLYPVGAGSEVRVECMWEPAEMGGTGGGQLRGGAPWQRKEVVLTLA